MDNHAYDDYATIVLKPSDRTESADREGLCH